MWSGFVSRLFPGSSLNHLLMSLILLNMLFITFNLMFQQGAFGKGALTGFGLTTYTLLGLGVVRHSLCFSDSLGNMDW